MIAASSVPQLIKAILSYQQAFAIPNPTLTANANGNNLYECLIAMVKVTTEVDVVATEEVPGAPHKQKLHMLQTSLESLPTNPNGKGVFDLATLAK